MRVVWTEEDFDGVEFGEWHLDRIRGKTGEAEESKKWFEKMLDWKESQYFFVAGQKCRESSRRSSSQGPGFRGGAAARTAVWISLNTSTKLSN